MEYGMEFGTFQLLNFEKLCRIFAQKEKRITE